MAVRGIAYRAVQINTMIPRGTTTLAGYPSRAVPSTAGAALITLMPPSKSMNAMTSPLIIRPAHSFVFEVGADCVADCMNFLHMSLTCQMCELVLRCKQM